MPDRTHEEIAVFAHELRGALTVILGYTEMLRRPLSDDERLMALDGIRRAVTRADSLCTEALAGRSTAAHPAARREPVDVRGLVEHVADEQRAATGRTIATRGASDAVVLGDEEALARVLTNLISNSVKYSSAPETVEVRVVLETVPEIGPAAVIEVSDRGPGIPAEERERLFTPFERLDRDAESPGTGLGLAVVRGVAQVHGGHAEIRSREGGGTTVRIELPVAD